MLGGGSVLVNMSLKVDKVESRELLSLALSSGSAFIELVKSVRFCFALVAVV